MKGKISVIVPIYNVEAYLRQCLDSIVGQTYRNLEIILVDDGSPDNCGKICDEYAKKDERIIVIHKENEGLSAARNDALDKASGEWTLFIDSDDWCDSKLCERALQTAEKYDADVVIYDFIHEGSPYHETKHYRVKSFPENFVTDDAAIISGMQLSALSKKYTPISTAWSQGFPWDKLFRTAMIEKNHLRFATNVRANEDVIFAIHAFQYAKRIAYIGEPLYHWRHNPTSIGNKFTPDRVEIDREIYQEMFRIGQEYKLSEEYYDALNVRVVELICSCGLRCFFHKARKGSIFQKIKYAKIALNSEPFFSALEHVDRSKLNRKARIFTISRHHNTLLLYFVSVVLIPFALKINQIKWKIKNIHLGGAIDNISFILCDSSLNEEFLYQTIAI